MAAGQLLTCVCMISPAQLYDFQLEQDLDSLASFHSRERERKREKEKEGERCGRE